MKDRVAKIRMFGVVCYDFSFAAAHRIDGVISITRNLWDICPGIIMCKESGLVVTNSNNTNINLVIMVCLLHQIKSYIKHY